MTNKKLLSFFFISLLLTSLVAPISVQGANDSNKNTNKNESMGGEEKAPVMKIDQITTLVDYEYKEEFDEFVVTIESDLRQSVVFSDVFSGVQGGSGDVSRIPQQDMVLEQGTNTYVFEVTEYQGKAVLGLSTPRASINIVEDTGLGLFSGSPTWLDVQSGALAGLVIGGILPIAYAFVKKYKEPDEPIRKF